eukprot:GGOE01006748.1.p1 GENE.GGOE01006748.1~~GGOE01006748.1.p1  ORF type:complete len:491 (-),score=85.80 GGOE01006748.1:658-2103(-)
MEDICYPHFALQGCPLGPLCCCAHNFGQLSNPDQWVIFKARNFIIKHFIADKYCRHQYFRHYSLVGYGSLIRCPSVADASMILEQYGNYCNPLRLREYIERSIAKKSWPHSNTLAKLISAKDESDAEEEAWQKVSSQIRKLQQPKQASKGATKADAQEQKGLTRPEEWLAQELATRGLQSWVTKELEARIAKEFTACHLTTVQTLSRPNGERDREGLRADKGEGCSRQVLEIVRNNILSRKAISAGWEALEKVWDIRKEDLDDAVLMYLGTKTPRQQEHILLTFAANNLTNVINLSAYLNCVIKEHEATSQVCIHFYAGVCTSHQCEYVHPIGTRGWDFLEQVWGITYKDFDYAVLNYLSKKPMAQQDSILLTFAGMNLKTVNNLSAYLSSVVQKFEKLDSRRASPAADEICLSDLLATNVADSKPTTLMSAPLSKVELGSWVDPASLVDLSSYTMYLLPANSNINTHANAKPFIPSQLMA